MPMLCYIDHKKTDNENTDNYLTGLRINIITHLMPNFLTPTSGLTRYSLYIVGLTSANYDIKQFVPADVVHTAAKSLFEHKKAVISNYDYSNNRVENEYLEITANSNYTFHLHIDETLFKATLTLEESLLLSNLLRTYTLSDYKQQLDLIYAPY